MSLKFLSVPTKRLAESIPENATTFKLTDIEGWNNEDLDLNDFGTEAFGVFRDANGTVLELFSFDPTTIADDQIDFVARGLSFDGEDLVTPVPENIRVWPKGTIVLLGSNPPQFFGWLKQYIDDASIAGAVPATETVPGIVKQATQAQTDAGTEGDGTYKYIVSPDLLRSKKYHDYIADAGGSDAYAITVVPAITAYAVGQEFTFKANTLNTGACTLNVNGLGARTLKKNVSADLETGDIIANQIVKVMYDGTNMQVMSRLSLGTSVVTGILYNSGTATKDLSDANAATTVIAHGLGVAPTRVRVRAAYALSTSDSGLGDGTFNVATSDYAGTGMLFREGTSTAVTDVPYFSTTYIIRLLTSATDYQQATVTVDATNITLTWAKTGTPTGSIDLVWEAEALQTATVDE